MQVPYVTEILDALFVTHDGIEVEPSADGYSSEGVPEYKVTHYLDKYWTLRFKTNIPILRITGNISFLFNGIPITYTMSEAHFYPNSEKKWGNPSIKSGTCFHSGYFQLQPGLYTVVDEEKELFSFIINW